MTWANIGQDKKARSADKRRCFFISKYLSVVRKRHERVRKRSTFRENCQFKDFQALPLVRSVEAATFATLNGSALFYGSF